MSRRRIGRNPRARVGLCTVISSGLTWPLTTVSPSPHDPVISTTSRNPDSVSSVNITPADARSLRTIFCTPTDSATARWA
jgi:hypothetical protein